MKKLFVFTILALFISTSAYANITFIGDPVEGNSWSQAFRQNGAGSFDLIAVRMVSAGDSFEIPTLRNFNRDNWSLLYENDAVYPTLASASGPAQTDMTFTIKFEGAKSNPLAFDFVAMSGDIIRESAHVAWTGSKWVITDGTWLPTYAEVAGIPAPGALLLGSLGVGLVGWFRRRRMV